MFFFLQSKRAIENKHRDVFEISDQPIEHVGCPENRDSSRDYPASYGRRQEI